MQARIAPHLAQQRIQIGRQPIAGRGGDGHVKVEIGAGALLLRERDRGALDTPDIDRRGPDDEGVDRGGGDDADAVNGNSGVDTLVGGNGTGTADSGDTFSDVAEIDELFRLTPEPDWVARV